MSRMGQLATREGKTHDKMKGSWSWTRIAMSERGDQERKPNSSLEMPSSSQCVTFMRSMMLNQPLPKLWEEIMPPKNSSMKWEAAHQTITWGLYKTAVLFLYLKYRDELECYAEYIVRQFITIHMKERHCIINFDKAVRREHAQCNW